MKVFALCAAHGDRTFILDSIWLRMDAGGSAAPFNQRDLEIDSRHFDSHTLPPKPGLLRWARSIRREAIEQSSAAR